MKRFFLLILAAAILVCSAAQAAPSDLLGDWSGEYYGMEVELTFSEDKTYSMVLAGDTDPSDGTWISVGGNVILDQGTGSELSLTLSGDRLTSEDGAAEFIRTGSGAEYEGVDPRFLEASLKHTLEDYAGNWRAVQAEAEGTLVDCESVGLDISVYISGTAVVVNSQSLGVINETLAFSWSTGHTLDLQETTDEYETLWSFGFVEDDVFDGMVMMVSSNGTRVYFQMEKEGLSAADSASEPEPTPEIEYPTLEKGSKGGDVVTLQNRLIELGYLPAGSADGDFGKKTRAAVEDFQIMADLPVTGVADSETQTALFSADAAAWQEYLPLRFEAVFEDPDTFMGKKFALSGSVVQAIEEEQSNGALVNLRIATGDAFNDVVLVAYIRQSGETVVKNYNTVQVEAVYEGLYTYESVGGESVTVPYFEADSVTVK